MVNIFNFKEKKHFSRLLIADSTAADNSLTYGQTCKSGSNQCKSSQGLSCTNGFCSCTSPYSWNTATSSCK